MRQYILAITVLLLGLTTHASAQSRGSDEALVGLREFSLFVKYGETEGLSEMLRPNILEILHARARILLSDADIPILESTDEAKLMGRPRLVFTVILHKEAPVIPAVLVDSKLVERVRLSRDPAKEIDLATWGSSGVGLPTVTQSMVIRVFDAQVSNFVKYYREANPTAPSAKKEVSDLPAPTDGTNTLQGLPGSQIFVSISRDPLGDEYRQAELQKFLQNAAEQKFKEAQIPVLRYINETEKAGDPLLSVFIKLSKLNPSIEIESTFWQRVRPLRDPKMHTRAVTWKSQTLDLVTVTDDVVLRLVNSQLDEFIKAYQTANPKLTSVRQ